MKFKYLIDVSALALDKKDQEVIEREGQKGIFETFISNLFATKYPEGIERPISRRLDALFRKLDETEGEFLELEQAEIDLLKDVLLNDKLKIHPRQSRYFNVLGRNLEKAIEETKIDQ